MERPNRVPTPSRHIAVGDVHGCRDALAAVIEAAAPQPGDTVVFLGDVCDRGPDSRGVIDFILELQEKCRVVLVRGNHEQMMLDVLDGLLPIEMWEACGGDATLASYGGDLSGIPLSHREFLSSNVLYYETETHFFIHANYISDLPLSEQPTDVSLWVHLNKVIPPPHQSGKTAVVGHTPQPSGEVLDLGHILCLDTFCVGGQWLTAMEFPGNRGWQATRDGRVRDAVVARKVSAN